MSDKLTAAALHLNSNFDDTQRRIMFKLNKNKTSYHVTLTHLTESRDQTFVYFDCLPAWAIIVIISC